MTPFAESFDEGMGISFQPYGSIFGKLRETKIASKPLRLEAIFTSPVLGESHDEIYLSRQTLLIRPLNIEIGL